MNTLGRLRQLIRKLRDPNTGCVWNRIQNFQSIVPYTIEEAYEVSDVVENEAWSRLPEEIGDLLYQVLYLCELGQEEGKFTLDSVMDGLELKLSRRNPGLVDEPVSTGEHMNTSLRWSEIKSADRKRKGMLSELDDIPNSLPSVLASKKIQERVASIGFEPHVIDSSQRKIKQELIDLKILSRQYKSGSSSSEKFGELMFALINIGLDEHVDLDSALRKANKDFECRFRKVERELALLGVTFQEVCPAKLKELWDATELKRSTYAKSVGN